MIGIQILDPHSQQESRARAGTGLRLRLGFSSKKGLSKTNSVAKINGNRGVHLLWGSKYYVTKQWLANWPALLCSFLVPPSHGDVRVMCNTLVMMYMGPDGTDVDHMWGTLDAMNAREVANTLCRQLGYENGRPDFNQDIVPGCDFRDDHIKE